MNADGNQIAGEINVWDLVAQTSITLRKPGPKPAIATGDVGDQAEMPADGVKPKRRASKGVMSKKAMKKAPKKKGTRAK